MPGRRQSYPLSSAPPASDPKVSFHLLYPFILESKPRLKFQPAVVRALRKSTASAPEAPGGLVGTSEQRRCDVADNRPRIVVIGEVADRPGHRKAVTPVHRWTAPATGVSRGKHSAG